MIIRKGNMTIIVYGDCRVIGYSYDTLILDITIYSFDVDIDPR